MDRFNTNSSDLDSVAKSKKIAPFIVNIFIVYYVTVFIFGVTGNAMIILSVYRFKGMRTVVNTFLVNLATADLLFILLSLFNCIGFLQGEWIFGDVVCHVQGPSIEISYTISIGTLAVIAIERYMSVCYPHKPRRTLSQGKKICGFVWLFSVLICSGLFHGYSSQLDENNKLQCRFTLWNNRYRFLFYVIHSIVIYLLPLAVMLYSHLRIKCILKNLPKKTGLDRKRASPPPPTPLTSPIGINEENHCTRNTFKSDNIDPRTSQESVQRRLRIIKLLATVTIVFFVLWTPFILMRILMYGDIFKNEIIWRVSQLLIFGNSGVNCFIYAFMSPAFRKAFKDLFKCNRRKYIRNK